MKHEFILNSGECGTVEADGRPAAVQLLRAQYGDDLKSIDGIDVPAAQAEKGRREAQPSNTNDQDGWGRAFGKGGAR